MRFLHWAPTNACKGKFPGETLDYRGFTARGPNSAANKKAGKLSMMRKIGTPGCDSRSISQQFSHAV
jgi:hypothetical protein